MVSMYWGIMTVHGHITAVQRYLQKVILPLETLRGHGDILLIVARTVKVKVKVKRVDGE